VSLRSVVAAAFTCSLVALGMAGPAAAFEGGGRMPSQAPLVVPGQHYVGQLTNRADDANFGNAYQVALWRLPPLTVRDVVYVDWHSVPSTSSPSHFPVCMTFAQGVDDFNWGSRFEAANDYSCDDNGPTYELSGSGTARTALTVQETNANSSYLEFYTFAFEKEPTEFEAFPYDFTVHPPQHYLGLALKPVKRVRADGILYASATLANGQPAPDGLAMNLTVTWLGGGSAAYAATSVGGGAAFQLALPETAFGEQATFVVSHPADGTYVEAASPRLRANVARPGPAPCDLAKRRKLSLTRQLTRLNRRANHARGANRRSLRRRAHRTARKLRAAKAQVRALC
jgi:hypothetical protein